MKEKLLEFIEVVSGMRKTIVMFILVLIAIIFRIDGLLDGNQFVELLKNTVIAFFSANSIEHIGETIKTYVSANGKKVQETAIVSDGDDAPEVKGQ